MHGIVNEKHEPEPEHGTDLRCESSSEQHMTICMTITLKSNKRTFFPQLVNGTQRMRTIGCQNIICAKRTINIGKLPVAYVFFILCVCADAFICMLLVAK